MQIKMANEVSRFQVRFYMAALILVSMANHSPGDPTNHIIVQFETSEILKLSQARSCYQIINNTEICYDHDNCIICNSLDMALESASKINRHVKIALYSAPINPISQCPVNSHAITGMHDVSDVYNLEFVGGFKNNNNLLCCDSISLITIPGSCEVYLKNVTVINCLIKYNEMNGTVTISSAGVSITDDMRVQSQHNKQIEKTEQLFTTRKIKSTETYKCQSSQNDTSRNIHNLCEREHVVCACDYETNENVTICIQEGYWYGVVDNTIVTAPCEYKNCKVSTLHGTDCSLKISANQFLEIFPETVTSGNCTKSRNGTLCSECVENHTFTFGVYNCVEFDNDLYAGVIIVSISFVILIITGLLFCLGFRNVNLASINGFVFFFSIVDLLVPDVSKYDCDYSINVFISIFKSFSQLQPEFRKFVDLPFVPENCKALCTVAIHYIFPTSVIIIIPSLVAMLSKLYVSK